MSIAGSEAALSERRFLFNRAGASAGDAKPSGLVRRTPRRGRSGAAPLYSRHLALSSALIVATWFLLLPVLPAAMLVVLAVLDGALAVWLLWLAERGY